MSTTTHVPIVFQSVADLAGDPEKLRKKASMRLPSLVRMTMQDAQLLAEALDEWRPHHLAIAPSWDAFCREYTGHGADVIDALCGIVREISA